MVVRRNWDKLSKYNPVQDSTLFNRIRETIRSLLSQNITRLPLIYLTIVLLVAIFGEYIAPYGASERIMIDGALARAESPSVAHPLGTTDSGYDVLSRVLIGARPTAITGLLGGTLIISIGLTISLTAGYVGGRVDDILMRITDLFFAIPFIPFALVVLAFFGAGFYTSIAIIGFLLWRGNARVIRAQVLQIKERPYITASRASGASDTRIVLKHILPNVAPMAILFFALGTGWSIIAQASLAFVGMGDSQIPSWGIVIRNAYFSGYMAEVWTWSIVPGLLIALTVLSCFLIGRSFETDDSTGGVY